MGRDVRDEKQTVTPVRERAAWRTPVFTEFDIVTNTGITNCGTGNDGVICMTAPS